MAEINIVIVQPTNYIHSMAFLEVAIYLKDLVTQCGHHATIEKNSIRSDRMNIVLGAHLLPDEYVLPAGNVIFNSEQLTEKNTWTRNAYTSRLGSGTSVWDYAQANLDALPADDRETSLIVFGRCDALKRIQPAAVKDIDFLFYGSLNERRELLLKNLAQAGCKVSTVMGLYGPERDALISRSKFILNTHFYASEIFQQIRCFYPLINAVPVISEDCPNATVPDFYKQSILFPQGRRFEEFAASMLSASHQQDFRKRFEMFNAFDPQPAFAAVLDKALDKWSKRSSLSNPASAQVKKPIKINLGSGKDYKFGYLNIDINPRVNPDLVLDLSQPINWPLQVDTKNMGSLTLEKNSVSEIIALDVLEHVPDLESLMKQCLDLLQVGGKFRINVPYEFSLGAWQDPTHVRAFNENSWLYYTDWFWYLGWLDYRFDTTDLTFQLSPFGEELRARKTFPDDTLPRIARAVDSMQVVLVKRATTPEERQLARANHMDFALDL